MIRNLIFTLLLLCLFGCSNRGHNNAVDQISTDSLPPEVKHASIRYAKGFSIEYAKDYKILRVFNPWQGANSITANYLLYPRDKKAPTINETCIKIPVPIRSIVCLSTTHIGFLKAIDEIESIVGISGSGFINNPQLQSLINQDKVVDVGYEQSLNQEVLISLNPDLLMAYSVNNELSSMSAKLSEFGLSTVLNAEYLEVHPLGKSEWIKFVASFFNKDEEAEQFFKNIEEAYLETTSLLSDSLPEPIVMTGLPWKDTWYVPTADSYAAHLIKDAGGTYLWNHLSGNKPSALSLEEVFHNAQTVEVWINSGSAKSLNEIWSTDERLLELPISNEARIYNNIKRLNSNGGNDYWESGLIEPHLILKDLIEIFHPDLQDHELVYYIQLK
jgi:iron complex transport system substrate-binding protein